MSFKLTFSQVFRSVTETDILVRAKVYKSPLSHLYGYIWMLAVMGIILLILLLYECTRTWKSKGMCCIKSTREKGFYPK